MRYFSLNSNIHIWRDDSRALFFDAAAQRQHLFGLDPESRSVVDALDDVKNLNSISLGEDGPVPAIVSGLVENGLGHIETATPDGRTRNLPPRYLFPDRLNTEKKPRFTYLLQYINSVTVYLPGACGHNCRHCDVLYRQGCHCTKSGASAQLDLGLLAEKLRVLDNLKRLSLVLSDTAPSRIREAKDLARPDVLTNYYVHWRNLSTEVIDALLAGEGLKLIKILVDLSDIPEAKLQEVVGLQDRYPDNAVLVFCITGESDLALLEKYVDIHANGNIEIRCVYTGGETEHIRKHYLLDGEDLKHLTADQNRIFGNRELNYALFGELVVFPDGSISLNENTEAIGTVADTWVTKLSDALNEPNPWLMTRGKTAPCSTCIYRDLCPPIRNLELYMGDKRACVA